MMEYFRKRQKRTSVQLDSEGAAHRSAADQPVLTEEDELFLHRITSEPEGPAPELPPRPHNQEIAVVEQPKAAPIEDDAHAAAAAEIPLPASPAPVAEGKGKGKEKQNKNRWSFLRRGSETKRKAAAADLQSAADGLKSPEEPAKDSEKSEAEKEQQELEKVMEQLNLAAENNRVFSLSDESRELLRKFTLVVKDLVHGVPTAYQDLESLLTNSESQLQKIFKSMPEFMQHLVTKLPNKMTEHLGPEILAAAAEKHGLETTFTQSAEAAGKAGSRLRVPSLKELLAKQGAVAGLLRAIMNFLRTRFPAVLGVNVLWSVALFVLLLVFWYCYKRGREVRLEKERALTEAEIEAIRQQVAADPPADYVEPTTTTAAEGATIEDVRRGAEEVARARAALALESGTGTNSLESSLYAPGGSLAQSLRREEVEKAAEKQEAVAGKKVEKEIAPHGA